MTFGTFSDGEWRALKDASTTGAGESARALAMLLRTDAPAVPATIETAVGPEALGAIVDRHGEEGIGISFALSGAVGGSLLVFLEEEAAFSIASTLLKRKVSGPDERALAALAEVGNILASAFLNGLSRYLMKACMPSVPGIAHAPGRVLLVAVPVRPTESGIVCTQKVGDIPMVLCFMPEPETARRIVEAVRSAAA
jgi:chemotaxis protein CheC